MVLYKCKDAVNSIQANSLAYFIKADVSTLHEYYGSQACPEKDEEGYIIYLPGEEGNFDGEGAGGSWWSAWSSSETFHEVYERVLSGRRDIS